MTPKPVPKELWGKDHWSTFAYLGCRVVGNNGKADNEHMRCCTKTHPGQSSARMPGSKPYPSVLKDGSQVQQKVGWHDDWDVADDLAAAGLIVISGTGLHPLFDLTDAGWDMFKKLTQFKRKGGTFSEFNG